MKFTLEEKCFMHAFHATIEDPNSDINEELISRIAFIAKEYMECILKNTDPKIISMLAPDLNREIISREKPNEIHPLDLSQVMHEINKLEKRIAPEDRDILTDIKLALSELKNARKELKTFHTQDAFYQKIVAENNYLSEENRRLLIKWNILGPPDQWFPNLNYPQKGDYCHWVAALSEDCRNLLKRADDAGK